MEKYTFQKSGYSIDIEGKEYNIDGCNFGLLKELETMQDKINSIQIGSAKISDLEHLIKSVLNQATGGDYDRLYKLAGGNLYALLDVTIKIGELATKGINEKLGKYI